LRVNLSRFLGLGPLGKSDEAKSAADPRSLRGDGAEIAGAIAKFLNTTGLFDRDAYTRAYPDVAKSGLDPLHHFVRVGIQAGRQFTSRETIARLWREVLRADAAAAPEIPVTDVSRNKVALYVSSLGNFFMSEIAEVLKAGFAEAGVQAQVHDQSGQPQRDATHHIVVAPHEFFTLGEGRRWASDDFVSRAILFSTEQLQTQWFALSLVFLLRAKAVADMNGQNAAILRKAGIRAAVVQPGYAPAFAPFAPQAKFSDAAEFKSLPAGLRHYDGTCDHFSARPLDVLFLGTTSPRREKVLAGYAEKFAGLNTFIYATRMTKPLAPGQNPMASSQVSAAFLQRTKILLNLHRDEYTYFEWWRLMQAFWHKAVVVTEPCFPHPLFKPGEHFFEEAPRHIPHLIAWLARAPDGQAKAEEVRGRAFELFSSRATAKAAALALLRLQEAS
jgi:hypothetical protein